MRIHQWQLRGPDRTVKEILPETPPTVVGHGILGETMLYLTARRAEDGELFSRLPDARGYSPAGRPRDGAR